MAGRERWFLHQYRVEMMSAKRTIRVSLFALFVAFSVWPQRPAIPVVNATSRDWNPRSFWSEPWGASGVHKGIDIFAGEGTAVVSPVPGIVVFSGSLPRGGHVVAVLTTQWRLHYFAHLKRIDSGYGNVVATGTPLGTVGTTGNAAGKPPHLHYSVLTLVPYPWRWDGSTQGWRKMFFLDPAAVVNGASRGV